MKQPIVIIGMGELGGVFARGFLRMGYPVYPILRGMHLASAAKDIPMPELVLVAVGKKDLHAVLAEIPDGWCDRLALIQNELLPRDWLTYKLSQPTVMIVRFEKKKGAPVKAVLPSPVYGPKADLMERALGTLEIPTCRLDDAEELLFALVGKNLYILTVNVAGLAVGGTVGELWERHRQMTLEVAGEVLDIQEWLTGVELPRERLLEAMLDAFAAVPEQRCVGRSAPLRLKNALETAAEAGLETPRLREFQAGLEA